MPGALPAVTSPPGTHPHQGQKTHFFEVSGQCSNYLKICSFSFVQNPPDRPGRSLPAVSDLTEAHCKHYVARLSNS